MDEQNQHRPAPPPASADADTVWVAVGGRAALMATAATAGVAGFDLLAIRALVTDQEATSAGFARAVLWVVIVLLSLLLPMCLLGLLAAVRERRNRIGVSGRGVWWATRHGSTLVPWEDVVAVRLLTVRHPARSRGTDGYRHHLELFPRQRPEADGRGALGSFVRQAEPPWPGLPPCYWEFELGGVLGLAKAPRPGTGPGRLAEAVRRHRPDLWAGTVSRDHGSSRVRRPRRAAPPDHGG